MLGTPSRATVVATCLAWTLALASAAFAWMSPDPQKDAGGLNISATGAMSIDSSRAEAAILKAPALAPGARAVGSVTIRNRGKTGYLILSGRHLVETPGAGGDSLSDALELTIRESGAGARPLLYSGNLATMPTLRLDPLPAAARRRFRFVARFPEPGILDNALMGARLRFDYRWRIKPKP